MHRFLSFTLLFFATAVVLEAQERFSTYYDDESRVVKEEFEVVDGKITGQYKGFFNSGVVKSIGTFDKGVAVGLWQYFYENSKLKMEGELVDNKPNGIWKYYNESGFLSKSGTLKSGKRIDKWQYFYTNGKVKKEGQFSANEKSGIWTIFYEDGSIKGLETVREDASVYLKEYYIGGALNKEGIYKEGKQDSIWNLYFESGAKMAEGSYLNGQKAGHWKMYHENGALASEGNYVDNQREGNWRYYYANGKLSSEGSEKNGQKDGHWKLYYETGNLKGSGDFNQGEGWYTEFYENGKTKIKGQLKNSLKEGNWLYYQENGTKNGQCFFVKGEGEYKGFYPSGAKKMEGHISGKDKVGTWKLYKEDGSLAGLYKPFYEENQPIIQVIEETDEEPSKKQAQRTKSNVRVSSFTFSNKFKGVVLAGNPLATIFGSLPLSIEYYFEDHRGYELQFNIVSSPFYKSAQKVDEFESYKRGFQVAARQKFYKKHKKYGLLYIGHELRYSSINHIVNLDSTSASVGLRRAIANEEKFEYSILIGDRLIENSHRPGPTVDVYAGIGLGYRKYNEQFDSTTGFSKFFGKVPKEDISIPWQLGIMFGYLF